MPSKDVWVYEVDKKTGKTWVLVGERKRPHIEAKELAALPYDEVVKIASTGKLYESG